MPRFFQRTSITPVSKIKKAKLKREKRSRYLPVFFGSRREYSRKVIKLAKEEMSVPTPPIFTPTNRSA